MRAILATLFFCALIPAAHAELRHGAHQRWRVVRAKRAGAVAVSVAHRISMGSLRIHWVWRVSVLPAIVTVLNHSTLAAGRLVALVCEILAWSSSARNGLLIKQVTPAFLA